MGKTMRLSGHIVDVLRESIRPGTITVAEGRIEDIRYQPTAERRLILPGFIDAHLHIESTLLVPSELARLAAVHGTIAALCDPHEIANVLGVPGMHYMIDNGDKSPFHFYFGAPSCVPACPADRGGAELDVETVAKLLARDDIKYLSEVMDVAGVVHGNPLVMDKILAAKRCGKRIDGHAPGLRGHDLDVYLEAGITTDHETVSLEEGREKLEKGMKLLIREGSAAKNFDELIPLVEHYPDQCMFCADDIYPDELLAGHIDCLVQRALARGIDRWKVLKAATVNPVRHYGLETGLLRKGDGADFIIIDTFEQCTILQTYIQGELAAENGRPCLQQIPAAPINRFKAAPKQSADFAVRKRGNRINVIGAIDGQIYTRLQQMELEEQGDCFLADPHQDILKLAVVSRYEDRPPAIAAISNFGLKKGAIASSVSHDAHNIVAVGVDDRSICAAVNCIIENKGGLAAVAGDRREILPLPIAGLMSDQEYNAVADQFTRVDRFAKDLGTTLQAPFMTLSFMSLLVVPEIKLSAQGLFDTRQSRFIDLFVRD
jgi:adenine deaminase